MVLMASCAPAVAQTDSQPPLPRAVQEAAPPVAQEAPPPGAQEEDGTL